jgi:hypothetical protein|tara:strand:+ start:339 stop:818 length:480 start_codon:yes stop_codon:yes gene_type:complete
MANKLIIKNSLEPQIDTSETVDGKTYSHFGVEQNTGNQGGTYESTFTDAKAIKYIGVVDQTSAAALTDGAVAFEGTATTTGTEPGANGVKAFYVKYDSTLGTVASVSVTFGSQVMATLSVGESVCIPLVGGALASCKVHASAFQNGVHEATVTAVLIGD